MIIKRRPMCGIQKDLNDGTVKKRIGLFRAHKVRERGKVYGKTGELLGWGLFGGSVTRIEKIKII